MLCYFSPIFTENNVSLRPYVIIIKFNKLGLNHFLSSYKLLYIEAHNELSPSKSDIFTSQTPQRLPWAPYTHTPTVAATVYDMHHSQERVQRGMKECSDGSASPLICGELDTSRHQLQKLWEIKEKWQRESDTLQAHTDTPSLSPGLQSEVIPLNELPLCIRV